MAMAAEAARSLRTFDDMKTSLKNKQDTVLPAAPLRRGLAGIV
jgi:hypothetical protein